jgi:hypothetical protein
MNPYELLIPVFALFGVAVVAPAWMYFVSSLDAPIHVMFLTSMVLPTLAALMISSWIQG